jgi:hypothetical protein
MDDRGGLMSDRVGLANVAEDEHAEQFMILIDDAEDREPRRIFAPRHV